MSKETLALVEALAALDLDDDQFDDAWDYLRRLKAN